MDWLLVVIVNLGAAFWLFWQHARGEATAETTLITTPVVFVVLNLALLLSIRAKNRRTQLTTPTSLIVTAALLALAASGSLWAVLREDLGGKELINEAVSSKPISAIKPERKAILVQLIRARLQNSHEEEAAASRMNPITARLYSAESYGNKTVIQSVLSQVDTGFSLDIAYAQKQQDAMNEFRRRMSKADSAYLEKFEAARRSEDDEDRRALAELRQWHEATIDLYKFAAASQNVIAVKGGQVVISDHAVKAIFAQKQARAVDLLAAVGATEKKLEERQEEALPDVSLSKLRLRSDPATSALH